MMEKETVWGSRRDKVVEQIFDLEVSADRPILRQDYLFPGCDEKIKNSGRFSHRRLLWSTMNL